VATDDVRIRIGVDGVPKAAGDVRRFNSELRRAEGSTRAADAALKQMDAQAAATSGKVSAVAGAVGNLGTVTAAASPAMSAFGGVIGSAGAAVTGLHSVLGGPGALVAAGLIAAIGLLAQGFGESEAEARDLETTTRKLNVTLEDHLGVIQKINQEKGTRSRVALGAGSVTEQRAEVERLKAALERNNANQDQLLRDLGQSEDAVLQNRIAADRRRVGLERQLAQAQQNLAFAEREQARFIRDDDDSFDPFAPDKGGKGAAANAARQQEQERKRFQGLIGGLAGTESAEEFVRRTEGEEIDARLAAHDRFLKEREKQNGILTDREKEHALNRLREFEAAEQKRLAAHEQTNNAMKASLETFGAAGTEAFVRMAAGQKEAGLAILAGIGDQMVAEGSRFVFTGLGRLLRGDPTGGSLAALGGAEIAAGLALGAAVAPSSPGSGGGGRTGPGVTEPTRFEGTGGGGGSQTIIVNMSSTLRPTYEDGRRVQEALREVEIQGR
jgi:hypothetical protein